MHTFISSCLNRRQLYSAACLVVSLAVFLPATAMEQKTLTLNDALTRTLDKHPALKTFTFKRDALQASLDTANLRPGYEVSVDAENFAGSGEYQTFDQAEFTLSLSSVIEMGDKRDARTGLIKEEMSRLSLEKKAKTLDLLGTTTRRYIEVLAAQARVELAKEALTLAQYSQKVVTRRATAGATTTAEVKRAKASVAQAELTLSTEQQKFTYQKMVLVALWGDTQINFVNVQGNLYQYDKALDFTTLYDRAKAHPSIEIFASDIRLKDAEIRLAHTQSSADISWSVGVKQFQHTDDVAIVAGATLPLFSGSRNTAKVSHAMAKLHEIQANQTHSLLTLHHQLYRAYSNREQAITTVEILQNTIIPNLTEALTETEKAYQRGRYSYVEYVSARQELIASQRTLIEAATSILLYGAEIEQLTGQPLTSY